MSTASVNDLSSADANAAVPSSLEPRTAPDDCEHRYADEALLAEVDAPESPAPYVRPRTATGASTNATADVAPDRSPYLVRRLLETRDENLFNHVKFNLVKRVVDGLGLTRPRVLDVGCGLQVAGTYLDRLGLDMDYFGVDYERRFGPDAVVDLMEIERLGEVLP